MDEKKNLVLPNFLCIGAQKTGTTALYHILKNHPEITVSKPRKETKFFLRDDEYKHGLEFYSKFFSHEKPGKAIGEFDPDYLFFDYIPERIFKDLGAGIKFIVMFRNPVDRAYSQYQMSVHKSHESKSFEEAIAHEEERLKNSTQLQKNHYSYLSRGKYDEQIQRYLKLFPRKNFLFINYDDEFKKDLPAVLKRIFKFLEIEDTELDTDLKMNVASRPKSKALMKFVQQSGPIRSLFSKIIRDPEKRRALRKSLMRWNRKKTEVIPLNENYKDELYKKYFEKNVEHLEKLTGENFSSWKPKSNRSFSGE